MANQLYANFILEDKIKEILKTKVDLQQYMNVDTSLTSEPGMQKIIHVYNSTPVVEDLGNGQGNTTFAATTYSTATYTVGRAQTGFQYTDADMMTDAMVVDTGVGNLAKALVNDYIDKAIAELAKTTQKVTKAVSFDVVSDAIATITRNSGEENITDMYILISPEDASAFRKAMKDELKYVEAFVRTGYIGSVCGVPVITTNALEAGKWYIACKSAVTLFVKDGVEVEQDRDINTTINTVIARQVNVVALTDKTKVVEVTAPKA